MCEKCNTGQSARPRHAWNSSSFLSSTCVCACVLCMHVCALRTLCCCPSPLANTINTTITTHINAHTCRYLAGDLPKDFVKCDKRLKEAAGIQVVELHGCGQCEGHVYGPGDKRTECPCCGAARYNATTGKAHEVNAVELC